MVTTAQSVWLGRLVTFLLSALAAGSAAYWVLQWPNAAAAPVPAAAAPTPAAPDSTAVARALGGSPVQAVANPDAAAAGRFSLTGVVVGGTRQGAALIAVDGKPARPYRIGATIAESWTLASVQSRRAVLKNGAGAEIAMDLPAKK